MAHTPGMEPQIQYTRTVEDVTIAYTTVGDGPPVLYCPSQWASMRHLLGSLPEGAWHGRLAAFVRMTIFDHAGVGASQPDVHDFSVDAQLRSVEAVAHRMPDEPFTIEGFATGCVSAALYARAHPERVVRLACLYPTPSIVTSRFAETMRADYSLGRRRLAAWAYPQSVSTQRWFGGAVKESTTADVAADYMKAFASVDLAAIFREIPVPTLICVTGEGQDRADALALARVVPDCQVVDADTGRVADAVLAFMGIDSSRNEDGARGTAVILFTDIADSTALTERMGDGRFREASRALDAGLRAAIRDAGGVAVEGKLLGDGVLATFPSAAQAIDGARRCLALSAASELGLHIGLHAGDVIREEVDGRRDVFGGAVNIASRICGLSAPGEILVSDVVRGMARSSAGVAFEDRGEYAMKGVGEPVRVYAVRGGDKG
jgi:class 3 adenylate cyclase